MPLDWNHVEQAGAAAAMRELSEAKPREGYRLSHRLQVRFRDCDAMRHVNHAVYLTYCEQARFEYWRRVARVDESSARSFIIARAEVDYRSPAMPGEWLDVHVRADTVGRTSFPMSYEIVSAEDGRLIAAARTVQVMFDYSANRPFPVPDVLVDALERFEGRSLRRSGPGAHGAAS